MNNQTRSKIRHEKRLLERKAVLTVCKDFEEELKQPMRKMERCIRLDNLWEFIYHSLRPAALGKERIGATSSFRYYLRYFENKYPEVCQ